MTNYVPVSKLSKKAKKEFFAQQRGSWNGLSPVSRVVPNKKAYNRKRDKRAFGWESPDRVLA